MDQPKISRILRLIVLLSGNRIYTVDELAAELCMVAELAELPLMSRKLEVRAAFQLYVG